MRDSNERLCKNCKREFDSQFQIKRPSLLRAAARLAKPGDGFEPEDIVHDAYLMLIGKCKGSRGPFQQQGRALSVAEGFRSMDCGRVCLEIMGKKRRSSSSRAYAALAYRLTTTDIGDRDASHGAEMTELRAGFKSVFRRLRKMLADEQLQQLREYLRETTYGRDERESQMQKRMPTHRTRAAARQLRFRTLKRARAIAKKTLGAFVCVLATSTFLVLLSPRPEASGWGTRPIEPVSFSAELALHGGGSGWRPVQLHKPRPSRVETNDGSGSGWAR